MLIGMQSAFACNRLERCRLKDAVICIAQIVKHLRLNDHKAAVDPTAVLLCLFNKAADLIGSGFDIQHTEPAAGLDGCHRYESLPLLRRMHLDERIQIHIAHTVAVCQQERLIPNVFLHALDTAACLRIQPRIDERHLPRF